MQAIHDIFQIWPSIKQMAADLDQVPDTVYRWRKKGVIPPHVWPELIERAAKREVLLTATQLMNLSAPTKRRGRPRKVAA